MTEYSLHSEVKDIYSTSGDELEVKVNDGFVIDVLKEDMLIEIQTKNFSAIKSKLDKLVINNKVKLVYPIAKQKWILYVTSFGEVFKRRKSPKKGKILDLFYELVHISDLFKNNNFSFEVLFIEEEEFRCNDGQGSWRRKGVSIKDRKLLSVLDKIVFENKQDFLRFLPFKINQVFTNKLLAKKLNVSVNLAQKITYCLRKMGTISIIGKKRKAYLFKIQNY
ncbi:MAG: hypothetical protein P8Y18_08095 [Candidatus Bathyarchaeota archaeon]